MEVVGQECRLEATNGGVQHNCNALAKHFKHQYDNLPPIGINTVAAARLIPVMPTNNCEPVTIIIAHPTMLLMRLRMMKVQCPARPYLIRTISRDV